MVLFVVQRRRGRKRRKNGKERKGRNGREGRIRRSRRRRRHSHSTDDTPSLLSLIPCTRPRLRAHLLPPSLPPLPCGRGGGGPLPRWLHIFPSMRRRHVGFSLQARHRNHVRERASFCHFTSECVCVYSFPFYLHINPPSLI